MKSRERVNLALNHKEADRVPLDFGGIPGTGISAIAYNKLKNYLDINRDKPTRVVDMWQQLAMVEIEIKEYFKIDTIGLWPEIKWKESCLPDGSKSLVPENWTTEMLEDNSEVHLENNIPMAKRPANGIYFDPIVTPLEDASLEDLEGFSWDSAFSFYILPGLDKLDMYLEGLEKRARFLRENCDLAVIGIFGGSIFEAAYGLRGFENFMMDLMANKKFAVKLLDKLVIHNIEYFKRYNELVGDKIDVIMVGGEDLGTQRNLLINPELYREIIKPRQQELWQYIKANSDAKLLLHSCGSIKEILEDFRESGIDAINPVQISAENMEPQFLKEEFGDRMTFWGGGCDTQHTLPEGTPEEVAEETKNNILTFKKGGGYVFSQVHAIQHNVPVENIVSMYETAYRHSFYE